MRYNKIPSILFKTNRKKIFKNLSTDSIAIVNSNDQMPRNGDQTFSYRQNSDFLYLTGIEQEESILLLCPKHKNKNYREILFLLKPDKLTEIWDGHKLTKDEAKDISGIENIKWLNEFDSTLREIAISVNDIFLNLNEYVKFTTPVHYKDWRFVKEIKELYPLHNFKRLAPILTNLRMCKEKEEIDLMQKSCDITTSAFLRVLKFIKPGVKEFEIEAEITHEFIKSGAKGHAYAPIIASGRNNCVLHYINNDKECKTGDLVLMDFGAEYAGYSADTTRTVPVNGKFTDRQREVYNSVYNVLKKARKLILKGTTINEINKKVNILIEKELLKLNLISVNEIKEQDKSNPVRMKYFMHGTSHFMGLDVHDVGSRDVKLKPGMVLSCEPGIYIEAENMGIRLENNILVTEDGQIDLFANEPIEAEEIERLMKS